MELKNFPWKGKKAGIRENGARYSMASTPGFMVSAGVLSCSAFRPQI